jgi:signal transduction histidine kinase
LQVSDVPVRVTRLGDDGPELPGMLPATLLGEAVDGRPPRRSVRDWIVDVSAFLVAVFGGVLLFFLQADIQPSTAEADRAPDLLVLADAVGGAVCILLLWWRRRWPVQLAVLTAVVTAFSSLGSVAAAIMLFTVAVHRRASVVAGVAMVGFVSGVVFVQLRPDPGMPLWVQVVINIPIVAAVVAWGMFARARRQLVISLGDRARRAESEQQLRIEQARYLERARIAREMHDVLAHRISLVSLHAGALEYRADAPAEDVAKSAAVIRSSAHEALQDLREILGVLRAQGVPGELGEPGGAERPQPTLGDVARLVEESRQAGGRVSLECTVEDLSAVPASIGRTAYRLVQEGLTTARKHAPGGEVVVTVSGGAGPGLAVEVRNRWPVGVPVTPGIPGAGQGLTGLAERTAIAGGRLEHGRTPAGDFRLAAWLPWPA